MRKHIDEYEKLQLHYDCKLWSRNYLPLETDLFSLNNFRRKDYQFIRIKHLDWLQFTCV